MRRQDPADSRDSALDFTKGVLVLFMVLYHWMNYFVGIEGPFYLYLRFIPPSFIFISGFLLSNVYPKKYGLSSSKLYIRLLIRGFKILVLFTFLNVMANALFSKSYRGATPGMEYFVTNAATIYFTGNGKMIFGVLLPISYLLILSTLIFWGMRATRYALSIICVALFIAVSFLDYCAASIPNLSLVAVGILGMVFGQYSPKKIADWGGNLGMLAGLYAGYLIALTAWGERYFLEVIGVCLSVLLIYEIGIRSTNCRPVGGLFVLLGKYSLFAYIAQIGLLQLLKKYLETVTIYSWGLWTLSFVLAFALTIITVWGVHQIRLMSPIVARMYRLVFA